MTRSSAHRRYRSLLLTLPALAGLPLRAGLAQSEGGTATAFVGVTVVPMDSNRVLRNATVLVRDGKIVAVGPRGTTPVPSGARIIPGAGKWLMPGLADSHIHLFGGDSAIRMLAQIGLAKGVTTVFEMAGSPSSIKLREEIRAGRIEGPVIFTAGPPANEDTTTFAGGVQFVDEHRAAGYDFIKVYNNLSKAGFRGIIRRAAQLGMPVVGHIVRSIDMEGTLGSGQRGIVHMEEFLYTYFSYRNSDTLQVVSRTLDTTAIPYLARATRKSGVFVTPTLAMFESIADQAEDVAKRLARPENRLIPSAVYDQNWVASNNGYAKRFNRPAHVSNLRAALAYQGKMTMAFFREGVPLLAGTDTPVPAAVPGFTLHEELRKFVSLGMTPYDALVTATRNPSEYMRARDFGVVAVGKRADLLLLDADPLADITNAEKIAGVMSRGHWLPRERLSAMLVPQR
jgi:hypothetical protein